jgi:hypothetical protein
MPPAAHTYGDLSIAPAANPDRHGYGNIELAAAAGNQTVKTVAADLTIQSAKNTYVKALLGNVDVSAQANYLLGAVTSTATLTGKSVIGAAAGIEHTGAAASFFRTSAGTLDVASQAGALTASGHTSAKLSSATGDVFIEATAAGKKIDLKAPTLNVDAGSVTVVAGGNYSLTSTSGYAATQAANDVRFTSDSGDFSATVTNDAKAFKAIAKNVSLGTDHTSTTTANGNLTVVGNLLVNGSTTAIDTVNMAVKDNLVQLNSAPGTAGRFPGLLMARHADDHAGVAGDQSAAFVFDESIDRFKLGYTADNATSASLTMSRHADLQVEKLYCTNLAASNISIPNFATVSFQINGNSTVAVAPEPALDHYGAYELIVRGPDGGSHGSWRVSKSASGSNSFVAIGASIQGELQDELIAVDWPANSPPVFKHAVTRTDGSTAPILYKLKYLGV